MTFLKQFISMFMSKCCGTQLKEVATINPMLGVSGRGSECSSRINDVNFLIVFLSKYVSIFLSCQYKTTGQTTDRWMREQKVDQQQVAAICSIEKFCCNCISMRIFSLCWHQSWSRMLLLYHWPVPRLTCLVLGSASRHQVLHN